MPFLKIFLFTYFKINLFLGIIRHYENIVVYLKIKMGEERLKQILNYEYWNYWQDSKTKTTGYVLFVNYEETYEVTFSWTQAELVENNRIFQCDTVTCKFTTNSGEFTDE